LAFGSIQSHHARAAGIMAQNCTEFVNPLLTLDRTPRANCSSNELLEGAAFMPITTKTSRVSSAQQGVRPRSADLRRIGRFTVTVARRVYGLALIEAVSRTNAGTTWSRRQQ